MTVRILQGDCRQVLASLPEASVHCCVTSPPYFGLRDYGMADQVGLEATPTEFVEQLVLVFREVRRVLRDDGTLWLNLGDSYASGKARTSEECAAGGQRWANRQSELRAPGLKPKDLIGIPWRVAFALQADGWYLRQDIIWHKPNPMPESVTDRCTKAHEYVFLLSKGPRYFFDADAMQEPAAGPAEAPRNRWDTKGYEVPGQKPQKRRERAAVPPRHAAVDSTQDGLDGARRNGTRNKRSVWTIGTKPFAEAHFATMAPELAENCIKAGCPQGGVVLDPFAGAGTTGLVADQLHREALLIELNPAYIEIARRRITGDAPLFAEVTS